MATRVLLTIDTELTWRHHSAGRGWQENFARSIEPAGVGLRHQLQRLARYGLKAVFFVDPMPALVFGIEPIRRIVAQIVEAGQEVQLHLHPNWTGAQADDPTAHAPFELTSYDEDTQRELIACARDLLISAGAPAPIAFRAGSFGADDATLRALAALGLRYDSSHNGSQAPWPCAIGLPADQIAPILHEGVIELPVTVITETPGRLRHLQICAVSSAELIAGLRHARDAGHPLVTLVSHSFELASRDGSRPNRIVARRFERLCAWLAAERATLPTAHIGALEGIALGADAAPMPARLLRRAGRVAGQILSNIEHRASA